MSDLQEKSAWLKKVALVKEIAEELGLESPHAKREADTRILLTWTENEKGMFLYVPGEYVSNDREAVKRRIKQMLDNGEAEEAPR
jgi:hypothetical protein